MFDVIFNLVLLIWAVIYAASNWNDASSALYVGMNLTLACWCGIDVIKHAAKL